MLKLELFKNERRIIIMMMRPRKYSVLNRSIARGISYALRDNNRKKYSKNTYSKQNPNDLDAMSFVISGIIVFGILLGLTS